MSGKENKVKLSVYVPPRQKRYVVEKSEKTGNSRGAIIRDMIAEKMSRDTGGPWTGNVVEKKHEN